MNLIQYSPVQSTSHTNDLHLCPELRRKLTLASFSRVWKLQTHECYPTRCHEMRLSWLRSTGRPFTLYPSKRLHAEELWTILVPGSWTKGHSATVLWYSWHPARNTYCFNLRGKRSRSTSRLRIYLSQILGDDVAQVCQHWRNAQSTQVASWYILCISHDCDELYTQQCTSSCWRLILT